METISLKLTDRMNIDPRAKIRAEKIARASRMVRDESMRINAEFSAMEEDPRA